MPRPPLSPGLRALLLAARRAARSAPIPGWSREEWRRACLLRALAIRAGR